MINWSSLIWHLISSVLTFDNVSYGIWKGGIWSDLIEQDANAKFKLQLQPAVNDETKWKTNIKFGKGRPPLNLIDISGIFKPSDLSGKNKLEATLVQNSAQPPT